MTLTKKSQKNPKNLNALEEAFVSPFGYDETLTICGYKIYTKQTLRDIFINAISEEKLLKHVKNDLKALIDNNIIVIGSLEKPFSIISMLKKLISLFGVTTNYLTMNFNGTSFPKNANSLEYSIMGYYCPTERKIVIVSANLVRFLIYLPEKKLIKVLLHELCHSLSNTDPNSFLRIFGTTLTTYYLRLIKILDNQDKVPVNSDTIRKVSNLIKTLLYYEKSEKGIDIKDAFEKWYETLVGITNDKSYSEAMIIILSAPILYLTNNEKLIPAKKLDLTLYELLELSQRVYYRAYEEALNLDDTESFFGQEFIAPSEVIALQQAKKPNLNILSVIKELRRSSRV